MLLHDITPKDIELPADANAVDGKTEMVAAPRKIGETAQIIAVLHSMPKDMTDDKLDDTNVRMQIVAALHNQGVYKSALPGRFPFATLKEVTKAKSEGIVTELLAIPDSNLALALRKDGKEYREGNPELKGNKAPTKKWPNIDALVKNITNGAVSVIRKAAKQASRRLKSEGVIPSKDSADTKVTAKKKVAPKVTTKKKVTPPKLKTPAKKARVAQAAS